MLPRSVLAAVRSSSLDLCGELGLLLLRLVQSPAYLKTPGYVFRPEIEADKIASRPNSLRDIVYSTKIG